jgi:hypothetical protein
MVGEILTAGDLGRLPAYGSNAPTTGRIPMYDSSTKKATYVTADQIASGASAVDGPSSATDNAIARFDGTTGKLIQNSPVTIADTTGALTIGGTGAITAPRYIDSTAISNASTSTTMSATGASLIGSAAATTFPLNIPGTAGCFKYIRCTNATTSRKIKISVAGASGTINNSKTVITLSNIGDAVTLFGETSTRWGICGSFVAGTTRIATS